MDPELRKERTLMQEKLLNFLEQRRNRQNAVNIPHSRVIDLVKRLEEGLFRTAATQEEYLNLETLESRLHVVIRQSRQSEMSNNVNSCTPGNSWYKTSCKNARRGPQPPKEHNSGGRPKSDRTVPIGSQKRKYTRKVPTVPNASGVSQVHQSVPNVSQDHFAGGSNFIPSQASSQPTMNMTQGACSQSNPSAMIPERQSKRKITATRKVLEQVLRRSPRKKTKN